MLSVYMLTFIKIFKMWIILGLFLH